MTQIHIQYEAKTHTHFWLNCSFTKTLKRQFSQKLKKIQFFSARLHADGKSGKVLSSTKHFWGFTEKHHCSILLNN